MRIAFITQCRPVRELGGARAQLELKPAMEARGWTCDLVGPDDLLARGGGSDVQAAFTRWLGSEASKYDVIDYDHNYLLPERGDLPGEVLHVARSVLFLPFVPLLLAEDHASWRRKLYWRWKALREARSRPPQPTAPFHRMLASLRRADALNVGNSRDEALARALGLSRICAMPYAIEDRCAEALAGARGGGREPVFVVLGSFESRKGAGELPAIFARVREQIPEARLLLLGAGRAEGDVRAAFPADIRSRVEVVRSFSNERLPGLLAGTSVGVFPSRHEGFPFAVLEQLHAGVPVVAYDAPGVSDQLPQGWRTRPGNGRALADLAVAMFRRLGAGEGLEEQARACAHRFRWSVIAEDTSRTYTSWLGELRSR